LAKRMVSVAGRLTLSVSDESAMNLRSCYSPNLVE
jgi:hypothetical protein